MSPRRASLVCSGPASLAFVAPASAAWTTPFEVSDAANRNASRAGAGKEAPPETRVSDDADGSQPELVTDAAGNALVTWFDPSDGAEDLAALRARYRPAGGAWGPTETLATGALDGHDLAMDAAGTAYAVFVDDPADAVVARTRASGDAGAWSTARTLIPGLSGVAGARVAAGPDDRAFAAFTADNGVPTGRAVYATCGRCRC